MLHRVPTFSDVEAAAGRLAGHALRTPLIRSSLLDERTGAKVILKPENLQRTGSFKFRGAYNKIKQIARQGQARSVVACSSGNHAQGVAEAARLCGLSATIVMPKDAPDLKQFRTVRSGAEIVLYDREKEDRLSIATELAARTKSIFVGPYDDPDVIAGQGTVGLEMVVQARETGLSLDTVLTCCGGGGLASGIALSLANLAPKAALYTVEPEHFDDTARSFVAGERLTNERTSGSLCDALLSRQPGQLTFPILSGFAKGGLVVSDQEALDAMNFAFNELKLVLEPGGAVALAALLSGKLSVTGQTVGVVLSGGNVDPDVFSRAIGG